MTYTDTKTNLVSAAIAMLVSSVTLVGVAGPVRAEPVSISVATGGVDLSTASGRAAMDARITRAARKACSAPGDDRDLTGRALAAECTEQAVANARVQLARVMDRRVQTAMAEAR